MIAIFKREFKACYTNITGWLFMSVILFFYGLYFYVYNLRNGYAYISYPLSAICFLLIVAVPILTMRIMAEEKRTRTDQLILTAPVSLPGIIIGKFLAAAAVFTIDILIIALTPLVLSIYGEVPMAESYTAILGFWLFGLSAIAIGIFASSLTESQIVSAVISFGFLFLGYMMTNISSLISEGGNWITKILNCYDLYTPFGSFMTGTLDFSKAIYFLTIILLFLFFTVMVIQKRRWSMSVKRIGLGAFSFGTIILAVAAAWGLNYGFSCLPTDYTTIDVTYNKMFSLTDQTKNYVKDLDMDVAIYVLSSEVGADSTLSETLGRYDDLSKHITVKYISDSETPDFYKKYTDKAPTNNSLIVVSDKRSRIIDYDDIYEYEYDYTNYSSSISAYDAEGKITSALEYVTMDSDQMPKVYILSGHNEVTLGNKFVEALDKANINHEELTLLKNDSVPEDAQLLIINGAKSDLSNDDLTKIKAYLDNGGTVLLNTSYDTTNVPNQEKLMADFGITKNSGIVMENDLNYVYGNTAYYLLPEVLSNKYTSGINNGYVFAPYACGLTIDEENENYSFVTILESTAEAVSKTNTEAATTSKFEEGDIEGPFYIGVASTRTDKPGTLIAFGSIDIFTDEANEIVSGSNATMFDGILNTHVILNEDALPVIESKTYTVPSLVITSALGILYGLLVMIIIPITLIVLGIIIWVSRKKR